MRKHIFVSTALAVLIIAASAWAASAQIEPYQRVSIIQRPLLSVPAFVRAGDSFRIEFKQSAGAPVNVYVSPVGAIGVLKELKFKTDPQAAGVLIADVPADTQEALFDLAVEFSGGVTDTQPHALKVVKEFKTEFDFIHITDIHFFMREYAGRNANDIRIKLLKDIAQYKPEFVVFTGDLGLRPANYRRDYDFFYTSFMNFVNSPLFTVPGNHDEEILTTPQGVVDGKKFWAATFGPFYFSTDYGDVHIVGVNTHEWADKYREETPEMDKIGVGRTAVIGDDQWNWLKNDLRDATQAGKTPFVFTHIPVEFLQGGSKLGGDKIPGPSASQFIQLMSKAKTAGVFVGHVHFNSEKPLGNGGTMEIVTQGAGADSEKSDDPHWGFRVVHVRDGKIMGYETHQASFADIEKNQ